MRTTLNIDDDVLQAVKDRARRANTTAGRVISELARHALSTPPETLRMQGPGADYGFKPLPSRGGTVTNELIDRLRECSTY
jgi:hypothetical protein